MKEGKKENDLPDDENISPHVEFLDDRHKSQDFKKSDHAHKNDIDMTPDKEKQKKIVENKGKKRSGKK